MNKKSLVLLALSLSCSPQRVANPVQVKVPIYAVGKSEAHPDCISEVKRCTYDSNLRFGVLRGYKCLTKDHTYAIYFKENTVNFNSDIQSPSRFLWYETKLSEDLSDDEFSLWCKSSFKAFKRFREETD